MNETVNPPVITDSPPPVGKKNFPWLLVILIFLGACLATCCLLVFGLGQLSLNSETPGEYSFSFFLATKTVAPQPTAIATPTIEVPPLSPSPTIELPIIEPTLENVFEPTSEELPTKTLEVPLPQITEETGIIIPEPGSPTGNQKKEDTYFFDDFSSNAFGWPVGEEDGLTFTLQNNTYSFSSLKPNHIDWVYLPVDFAPIETRFTVKFPEGSDQGWFGVICQYQDVDIFYTVDIDPLDKKYIIGQMKDQEYNPLSGEDWKPLKFLDNPLNEKNKIGVSCYPTAITLYINDKFVTSVIVKQPVKKQGKAGIFINTKDDLPQPYLMVIDNVEIWQPKQ